MLQNVSQMPRSQLPPPIILSHFPLFSLSKKQQQNVFGSVRPKYAFTGHTHKHLVYRHTWGSNENTVEEHTVPTISYRMGTSEVGVALASIDPNGRALGYQECWFPYRYPSLGAYAVLGLILAVALAVRACCGPRWGRQRRAPKARKY